MPESVWNPPFSCFDVHEDLLIPFPFCISVNGKIKTVVIDPGDFYGGTSGGVPSSGTRRPKAPAYPPPADDRVGGRPGEDRTKLAAFAAADPLLLSPAAGQKYPSGAGVHILFLLASFVLETTV